ncbi:MAG: ABC transporter ATP-binding protein [Gammaproteobacteria bacterium]|nr:ABC transporter ATP-binding protein [Gammaproteobacteria bacterium]MYF29177.1 ABC transporter ATP-binding protein [Gammaproteobacteria bacterium]MYK48238.1 ABC transporter ATP-binding protein [Gammaproteobacteria bacterium]
MSSAEPVLAATGLSKAFSQGGQRLVVLRSVDLEVARGEWVGVVGRSGAGKSTLLHILAGLTDPDDGSVEVMGQALTGAGPAVRARIRNARMGFVYQLHHLLPEFSALENVAVPLLLGGTRFAQAAARARDLLAEVGLAERFEHRPHQLSGGERQRVAVARALATAPAIVLADEPTGNLDRESAEGVVAVMSDLIRATGTSFVVVTHDTDLAGRGDKTLALLDGVLTPVDKSA